MVGSSRIRFHISPAPVESATHHKVTSPHFEPHSVERSLKEMDGAVVGVDDELAIVPIRMFVSANQKFQGELFEDVIACGLPTPTAEVPAASTWFNTQNRVNGWTYDEMGNLLQVLNGASVLRSAWYDAENRQTQAVVNGGAASNYDGDGRRGEEALRLPPLRRGTAETMMQYRFA